MMPQKITISNKDDILGSIILALATRCAGQQIAGGMTKDFLAENGYFILRFNNQGQIDKFSGFVRKYLPEQFQGLIHIAPFTN